MPFFKSRKNMTDKKTENFNKQDNDKLSSDKELQEEMIARELNMDDSLPGTQHLNDEVEDESDMEKSNSELEEMKDKYLRLMAEFDNYKRRNAKERNELMQTAGKDILQSLLVVLDDMDRADKQIEKSDDVSQIKEGINLVFNKLRNILQQKGLRKMESRNSDFDADLHEAITEIPVSEDAKGKVVDEIEPGYYLNDKLIRHAKVVVGK